MVTSPNISNQTWVIISLLETQMRNIYRPRIQSGETYRNIYYVFVYSMNKKWYITWTNYNILLIYNAPYYLNWFNDRKLQMILPCMININLNCFIFMKGICNKGKVLPIRELCVSQKIILIYSLLIFATKCSISFRVTHMRIEDERSEVSENFQISIEAILW